MATNALRGGIDLGGTKIEAIVVDEANAVLGSARRATPTVGGPADVAREMAGAMADAASAASVTCAALRGVGVGSPGTVDRAKGTVSLARNLPGWIEPFDLAGALREALGTTVAIGNDVQVATTAELELGAGRAYSSLLGVFWGTGVGGGVVLDRKLWLGRGAAGEIGHTVVKLDGRRCPCGRRGCLEAYAGRASMEARARRHHRHGKQTKLIEIMTERGRQRMTSSVWAHALEHGDPIATRLVEEAVAALGAAIGSAVNLLDIEAVIIGGGLGVRFGAAYVARIAAALTPHLLHPQSAPAVLLTGLGDLGGALGAALLVDG